MEPHGVGDEDLLPVSLDFAASEIWKGFERAPAVESLQRKYGGVAQLGEHLLCTQGVRSSNLLISTRAERLKGAKAGRRTYKWANSSAG